MPFVGDLLPFVRYIHNFEYKLDGKLLLLIFSY